MPLTFTGFKLSKALLKALADLNYKTPTPIQADVLPLAKAGEDIIGIAQTGTGKTAAFLLPILDRLGFTKVDYPRALILAPTRELVLQIEQNCKTLTKAMPLKTLACYGGINIKTQIKSLNNQVDILISTPQRLLDIHVKGVLFLRKIKILVIDEADKMVDMGFMPQLNSIFELIPSKKRQNLLFSASMPASVLPLIDSFLLNPKTISITPESTLAQTISTKSYLLPNNKTKAAFLLSILPESEVYKRVVIFANTKKKTQWLYGYLRILKRKLALIHANKDQNTRLNILRKFRAGEIDILIATDLISRGLDLVNISHVINFDLPYNIDDYVHRVGRTGRYYRLGIAINLCNEAEKNTLKDIAKRTGNSLTIAPLPDNTIIYETPLAESQAIRRALDYQRQQADPNYKGAFHPKKKRPKQKR